MIVLPTVIRNSDIVLYSTYCRPWPSRYFSPEFKVGPDSTGSETQHPGLYRVRVSSVPVYH